MDARPHQHRPPPLHRHSPIPFQHNHTQSLRPFRPHLDLLISPPPPVRLLVPRATRPRRRKNRLHLSLPQKSHHQLCHVLCTACGRICLPAAHGCVGLSLPNDFQKDHFDQKHLGCFMRYGQQCELEKLREEPQQKGKRGESRRFFCTMAEKIFHC